MDTWPTRLFPHQEHRPSLEGAAVDAGGGIGPQRFAQTDGGGWWRLEMTGIFLDKKDDILTMRALEGRAMGGATEWIVPLCECRFKPKPSGVACAPHVTHSDGSTFSDGTEYVSGTISATIGAAALRATTLQMIFTEGGPLRGGEHFAIEHPVIGWRLYRIVAIDEDDPTQVTIVPPLRDAVPAGTVAEFDSPRFVARLINAREFLAAIRLGRFSSASPIFEESFDAFA